MFVNNITEQNKNNFMLFNNISGMFVDHINLQNKNNIIVYNTILGIMFVDHITQWNKKNNIYLFINTFDFELYSEVIVNACDLGNFNEIRLVQM